MDGYMGEKTGAVLVAAGLSSRMGSFKPLLPFAGSTISRHVVGMVRAAGADPIVVVTGFRGDELEAHLAKSGARFVRNDRFAETQMFDSVLLGVRALASKCARIMIMPMDMPAIQPETIRRALAAAGPIVRTVDAGKPGHPVVIDGEAATAICEYSGEGGLRGALEATGLPIEEVAVEDAGARLDADTPEEYRALLELCD